MSVFLCVCVCVREREVHSNVTFYLTELFNVVKEDPTDDGHLDNTTVRW